MLSIIQSQQPGLLQGKTNIGFSALDIIGQQSALVGELRRLPEFEAGWATRRNLVTLEIGEGEKIAAPPAVDTAKLESLKSLANTTLGAIGVGTVADGVANAKMRALADLGTGNPNGFLTGLINTLPAEKRKAVFTATGEQKLELLAASLPADVVQAGFRGADYGVSASSLTPAEAIASYRTRAAAEKTLLGLYQVERLLAGELHLPASDATAKIAGWGARNLPVFDAKPLDGYPKFVSGSGEKALAEAIPKVTPPTGKPTSDHLMTLEELPPYVSVFRGCSGGDCSTKLSFGYPWSPQEHVMLVKDATGGIKGYVSFTIVEAGGRKSAYVHTIQGAHISHEDTLTILGALNKSTRAFGAERLIVPGASQASSNINYGSIQEGVEKSAGRSIALNYLDKKIRGVIDEAVSGGYDAVSDNKSGRVFEDSNPTRNLHVATKESAISDPMAKDFSKADALMLAMAMEFGDRKTDAAAIRDAAKITPADYAKFVKVFKNQSRKPLQEYLDDIARAMERHGLQFDRKLLETRPQLFFEGAVAAKDATAPANQATVRNLVLAHLDDVQNLDARAIAFVHKNPEMFRESERFQRVMHEIGIEPDGDASPVVEFARAGAVRDFGKIVTNWLLSPDDAISDRAKELVGGFDDHDRRLFIESLLKSKTEITAHDALRLGDVLQDWHEQLEVDGKTEGLLAGSFFSADPRERRLALAIAASMTHDASPSWGVALTKLFDPDPEVAIMAARLLRDAPDLHRPAIAAAVKRAIESRDVQTRAAALLLSHELGLKREELGELLKAALKDPSPAIRRSAVEAAAEFLAKSRSNQSAVLTPETLLALRADDSPAVRVALVRSLSKIKQSAELLAFVGDGDTEVRREAARLAEAIPALRRQMLPFLNHADEVIRRQVMDYLARQPSHTPAEDKAIVAALSSNDGIMIRKATDALRRKGMLNPAARGELLALTSNADTSRRALAISLLAADRGITRPVYNELLKQLTDQDPAIKASVVGMIAQKPEWFPKARVPELGQLLRHTHPLVQDAASEALGALPIEGKELLLSALQQRGSEKLRLLAIKGLAGFHDPAVLREIATLSDDPHPSVRRAVLQAIGRNYKRLLAHQATLGKIVSAAVEPDVIDEIARQLRKFDELSPEIRQALASQLATRPEAAEPYARILALGEPSTDPALLAHLDALFGKNPEMALRILGSWARKNPALWKNLDEKLANTTEESTAAALLAQMRGRKGPDNAWLVTVAEKLRHSDANLRQKASQILAGRRWNDKDVLSVVRAMFGGYPEKRRDALKALQGYSGDLGALEPALIAELERVGGYFGDVLALIDPRRAPSAELTGAILKHVPTPMGFETVDALVRLKLPKAELEKLFVTQLGKFRPGMNIATEAQLMAALKRIGADSAVAHALIAKRLNFRHDDGLFLEAIDALVTLKPTSVEVQRLVAKRLADRKGEPRGGLMELIETLDFTDAEARSTLGNVLRRRNFLTAAQGNKIRDRLGMAPRRCRIAEIAQGANGG